MQVFLQHNRTYFTVKARKYVELTSPIHNAICTNTQINTDKTQDRIRGLHFNLLKVSFTFLLINTSKKIGCYELTDITSVTLNH